MHSFVRQDKAEERLTVDCANGRFNNRVQVLGFSSSNFHPKASASAHTRQTLETTDRAHV
jgi:hypothetical protein